MSEDNIGMKLLKMAKKYLLGSVTGMWEGILSGFKNFTDLLKEFKIGGELTDKLDKLESSVTGVVGGLLNKADKSQGEALTGVEDAINTYFANNPSLFTGIDADTLAEIKAQTLAKAQAFLKKNELGNNKPELAYAAALDFRDDLKLLLIGDKKDPGLLPPALANRDALADSVAYNVSGIPTSLSSDSKAAALLAARPDSGLAGILAQVIAIFSAEGFDEQTFSGSILSMAPPPTLNASIKLPNLPTSLSNSNPQDVATHSAPIVQKSVVIKSNLEAGI